MRYVADADGVVLNEALSGYTMPIPGGSFAQMQTNMAATLNIDWVLGIASEILRAEGVERQPEDLLAGLDDRILDARPGAALFHPYISSAGERGPFTEPDARASFTGLDQSTGWFDLLRAVYDGLMLAARDCYSALGDPPREVRITGGAAKSPLMRRLLASSLNRPVRAIAHPEAGAAGAAMIAAVQQGISVPSATPRPHGCCRCCRMPRSRMRTWCHSMTGCTTPTGKPAWPSCQSGPHRRLSGGTCDDYGRGDHR